MNGVYITPNVDERTFTISAGNTFVTNWRHPYLGPDPSGVREPRRPLPEAPAGAMALDLPRA